MKKPEFNPPPPPANPPPAVIPQKAEDVIAVEIPIETYKEIMAILQELPYRVCGQVMNQLAPGVKSVFAEPVDDGKKEGAE